MVEHQLVSDYHVSLDLLNQAQLECLNLSEQFTDEGRLAVAQLMLTIGGMISDAKAQLDEYEVFQNVEKFWAHTPTVAHIVHDVVGVDVRKVLNRRNKT